jgi:hypothetical protein
MNELWEIMPAETRTHVETEIQCWTPPKRGQVRSFLNYLVTLLRKYRPKVKTRRGPSIKRRYLQRVGKVWGSSGLNIGRAHNGAKIESVESPFQRFARLALLAAGDSSGTCDRRRARDQPRSPEIRRRQSPPSGYSCPQGHHRAHFDKMGRSDYDSSSRILHSTADTTCCGHEGFR